VLRQVHLADVFDHRASSGLRYIVNPPGSPAGSTSTSTSDRARGLERAVRALVAVGFDGILTACVFAWEERAVDSARFMLAETTRYWAAAVAAAGSPG
jgi:myo-inositol catabolism protein IolH